MRPADTQVYQQLLLVAESLNMRIGKNEGLLSKSNGWKVVDVFLMDGLVCSAILKV